MAVTAVPQWPSNILPFEPRRNSYRLRRQDDNSRSEFDVGPRRVRRRFTDSTATAGLVWHLTAIEFEYLQAFIESDLQNGSLWFDVSLFTGSLYETKRCRFLGPVDAQDQGYQHWVVAAQLEIRSLGSIGGGIVWLLDEYGEDWVLNTFFPAVDTAVNTTYYDALDPRYT